MIVLVMGVSGSGKGTIGKLLATAIKGNFIEGDDYHPQANKDKMKQRQPLTDEDRTPWLAALQQLVTEGLKNKQCLVISCSALKAIYRYQLRVDQRQVILVYLKGTETIVKRMSERQDHFFSGLDMLISQFKSLEEPKEFELAIEVDVSQDQTAIVSEIMSKLPCPNP